jgi:hypothetical protein
LTFDTELSIMSNSTLKKFVLAPVVLSAAVFGTLTLPLALLGKQPIVIQLQQEPVFQGQLRDISTPYLGFASVVSLGAGFASVAFTGWRRSTHKSSQVEAQLSDLAQHLQEKEAQLEALKLSESRLVASGLSAFVDDDIPLESILKTSNASQNMPLESGLKTSSASDSIVEVVTSTNQPIEEKAGVTPAVNVQAEAQFTSAQTSLGYTQAQPVVNPPTTAAQLAPQEVEELHSQLQQIMAQMASVQAALSATRTTGKPENGVSPQVAKSWSVEDVAS